MSDDRQQALLLAQLNKKRELKQKYLYSSEAAEQRETPAAGQRSALGGLAMTNIMLLAIRERADVFSVIARLRAEARSPSLGGTLFDAALAWCGELAEAMGCGVYEFLIDDRPKRRKIVHDLLEELKRASFDDWEDIRVEDDGSASFTLPHFDCYYKMTDQPRGEISLVFRREAAPDGGSHYWLMLGDLSRKKPDDLFPDHAILWDERRGALKEFVDGVVADLEGGWPLLREGFVRRRELIRSEAEKLGDLCEVLAERPEGLNFQALLQKEKQLLETLRAEEHAAYSRMPASLKAGPRGENAKNCLLLLGGAVKSLERALQPLSGPERTPSAEALSEAAYLLEQAGGS